MNVELIRDTLARVVRALEAIGDGDLELANCALEDLSDDLLQALALSELPE
jgi:hypothetical protein